MSSFLFLSILFTVLFNLGNVYCWPTFRFYSNPSNLTSFIALSSNNIKRSGFDVSKETKFLIHGFGDNGDITNMRSIKDALLKKVFLLISTFTITKLFDYNFYLYNRVDIM